MRRRLGSWVLGLGLALAAGPALANCKLALALALDISSSVNDREYRIQIDGLAKALADPDVIQAILSPEGSHIAVTTFEWSGYNQQDLVTGWEILDSREKILSYAGRLAAHRRPYSQFPTALGKAVQYGAQLFQSAPPCGRWVMDLSGDGENNDGIGPAYFRQQGELNGITINGLVIRGAYPDPAPYYESEVIQGPGAFLMTARDFNDYPRAIVAKLLREIGEDLIIGDSR